MLTCSLSLSLSLPYTIDVTLHNNAKVSGVVFEQLAAALQETEHVELLDVVLDPSGTWQAQIAVAGHSGSVGTRYVGAPRGSLHEGRSTGSLHGGSLIFFILTCAQY